MISFFRRTKTVLLFGGAALWGLLVISCVVADRTMLVPPVVPGATFSGDKSCTECHADLTDHFAHATHAKVALADPGTKIGATGCETCHGAGSLHVKSGGAKGTIVNPRKSPETCFQCHVDKRGSFALPNSHGINTGTVTCGDCHEPHAGNMIKGTGAVSLDSENETCTKCHTAQKGPFIFGHSALREGCIACHNPHGSINAKMLVARDANLCLRCHLQTTDNNGVIIAGGEDHRTRLQNGTCWSAGCHEAIHGSNASKPLRY
jgi:predicted CXXCH cytochrome family protein